MSAHNLQTRYRAYVTLAETAEAAQDWRGAAVDFYSAYCEHPSKWDETPSAAQSADREALLTRSRENWAKHLGAFKIGKRIRIPSGMGGVFDGVCSRIDGERIFLIIDNPQYPDWHGREYSAHYQDARRFEA